MIILLINKIIMSMKAIQTIRSDPSALLKYKVRTPDMYLEALSRNGLLLEHVPANDQTEELCLIAIRNDFEALQFSVIRTPVILVAAIRQYWHALQYFSESEQTPDVIAMVLPRYPGALQYVKAPTKQICRETMAHGGLLCHVPLKYRDVDICTIAIENNPENLKHVPKKVLTPRMEYLSVAKWGFTIKYIKDPTHELCVMAINNGAMNIRFIKPHYRTEDLQIMAVEGNHRAYRYCPDPSEAVSIAMVSKNGNALAKVRNQTQAICEAAIANKPRAAKHIKYF